MLRHPGAPGRDDDMHIPAGLSEAAVTAALLEAAKAVSGLYVFGYFTREDAQQLSARERDDLG